MQNGLPVVSIDLLLPLCCASCSTADSTIQENSSGSCIPPGPLSRESRPFVVLILRANLNALSKCCKRLRSCKFSRRLRHQLIFSGQSLIPNALSTEFGLQVITLHMCYSKGVRMWRCYKLADFSDGPIHGWFRSWPQCINPQRFICGNRIQRRSTLPLLMISAQTVTIW